MDLLIFERPSSVFARPAIRSPARKQSSGATALRKFCYDCVPNVRSPMPEIELLQDIDGRWSVTLPGLIVADLSQETAEAFVAAYRRLENPVID